MNRAEDTQRRPNGQVLDTRHDIPPALCGDLANRPGHDLGKRNRIKFLRGEVLTGQPLQLISFLLEGTQTVNETPIRTPLAWGLLRTLGGVLLAGL